MIRVCAGVCFVSVCKRIVEPPAAEHCPPFCHRQSTSALVRRLRRLRLIFGVGVLAAAAGARLVDISSVGVLGGHGAQLAGQTGGRRVSVLLVENVGQCVAPSDATGAVEVIGGVDDRCGAGAAGAAGAAAGCCCRIGRSLAVGRVSGGGGSGGHDGVQHTQNCRC